MRLLPLRSPRFVTLLVTMALTLATTAPGGAATSGRAGLEPALSTEASAFLFLGALNQTPEIPGWGGEPPRLPLPGRAEVIRAASGDTEHGRIGKVPAPTPIRSRRPAIVGTVELRL